MTDPAAIRLIEESIPEESGEPGGFGFRLIVSPAPGRMRHLPPVQFHEGEEWVSRGQPVAVIEQGDLAVEVVSPVGARVAGILVRDGEPVLKGQPIVWLDESAHHPDGEEHPR